MRGLSGLEKRKSRIEPDLSTKECAHILLLDRKGPFQQKWSSYHFYQKFPNLDYVIHGWSLTIVVAPKIPKEVAEDEINKKLKTSQWKFESSRC